jgi:outer membrane protein OmpA-like peptidoglycan-associated protein
MGSAFAVASGEKVKTKGVIMNRSGDTVTIKTWDGTYTVVLNTESKVRQAIGLVGARHKDVDPSVLMAGLKVHFEGVGDDQGRVVAKNIDYDFDDLALAEVIQAGLNPTAQQQAQNMQTYAENKVATDAAIAAANVEIEANKQRIATNQSNIQLVADKTKERFTELTEWVPKAEATVHFDTGESIISDDHKAEIKAMAQQALNYKGYVIEVKGFADSVGRLSANTQLSKDRAESVVAYLLQECGVPVKNIVAPGALSETNPKATNETRAGRAENRRVELRVLVNRGVAGPGN